LTAESENDCKYRDKNNSIFPFYCLNDDNLSDYCYYYPDEVDDCVYLKLSKIRELIDERKKLSKEDPPWGWSLVSIYELEDILGVNKESCWN